MIKDLPQGTQRGQLKAASQGKTLIWRKGCFDVVIANRSPSEAIPVSVKKAKANLPPFDAFHLLRADSTAISRLHRRVSQS
jgi:hypothetical protein